MEQLVSNVFAVMGSAPLPIIYLIAAVWVGVESAGIGLPIEPMMLFVGSLVAQHRDYTMVATVIASGVAIVCVSLGCLVFASVAYLIGRRVGTTAIARVGRFVGLTQTRADHIELWLRHRGGTGVFIARVTPIVRTFGSYMMGAANIPTTTFALSTLAGSLVYCGGWIILGDALGANYQAPLEFLQNQFDGRGAVIVVAVIVIAAVLHHYWGRLGLHRIALHFRLHKAQLLGENGTPRAR